MLTAMMLQQQRHADIERLEQQKKFKLRVDEVAGESVRAELMHHAVQQQQQQQNRDIDSITPVGTAAGLRPAGNRLQVIVSKAREQVSAATTIVRGAIIGALSVLAATAVHDLLRSVFVRVVDPNKSFFVMAVYTLFVLIIVATVTILWK